MARNSLDQDMESLPRYMVSALGVDRSWTKQARCRKVGQRDERNPWTVSANETVEFNGETYTGVELIQLALLSCFGCPAQYECVRFALKTWENWGTWACDKEHLNWLHNHPDDADALINYAEEDGIPVQTITAVAVKHYHAERRRERLSATLAS